MKMRRSFSLFLAVVMIASLFATMTISTSADEITAGTAAELKTALTTPGASVKLTADITITAKIDITAATVDGDGHKITLTTVTNARMFNVTSTAATFTMKNVTLEKAVASSTGVIQFNNANCNIVMENVTVKDTAATAASNGLILFTVDTQTVTMTGCTVIPNAGSTGIYAKVKKLTLTDTTIDGVTNAGKYGINTAKGEVVINGNSEVKTRAQGVVLANATKLTLESPAKILSTVSNAISLGGSAVNVKVIVNGGTVESRETGTAIYNDVSSGSDRTITINGGSILSENQGIYNPLGTVTINGGTITATKLAVNNGGSGVITVAGGTITGGRAAIYNGGSLTLSGSAYSISSSVSGNPAIVCTTGKTVKVGDTDVTSAIALKTGASVRIVPNSSGIRFSSYVPTAELTAMEALKTGSVISSYEYHTVICALQGKASDEDRQKVNTALPYSVMKEDSLINYDIKATATGTEAEGDNTVYNAALVNFNTANYETRLGAFAYNAVTLANGTLIHFSTGHNETNNVRTVKEVATAALAVEPSPYDAAQTTVLQNYVNGIANYAAE